MSDVKLLTEADVKRLHNLPYGRLPDVLAELRERGPKRAIATRTKPGDIARPAYVDAPPRLRQSQCPQRQPMQPERGLLAKIMGR